MNIRTLNFIFICLFIVTFSCSTQDGRKKVVEYYDEDLPLVKAMYYVDKDNLKDSIYKEYYFEGGALMVQTYFKKGKQNGEHIAYDMKGNKELDFYFIDDKLHGISRRYHGNGQVLYEVEYKDHQLWNILKLFDKDGNPLEPGEMKNGNGFVYIYDENGNLLEKGNYKDGRRHGKWLSISGPDGENEDECYYENGKDTEFGVEIVIYN